MVMVTSLLFGACSGDGKTCDRATQQKGNTENVIGRSDIKVKDGRMTPEVLWAMGRIGGMNVSPDGQKVVYTVAYYSVPENRSNREVFVMNADGTDNKQITKTSYSENEAVWIKGGKKIAFLCNESGSSQLWEMNPDGSDRRQLSEYEGDIEGFAFSPDEKKVLFISQVKTVKSTADKYPDLDKATGIIVTDLMYKHWDEWVTTAPHPFVADFDGKAISNPVDIMEGEPFESPMKPFGGIEQLAWNTTSDKIAYTSRKKTGKEYALSTNSDIYVYDLNTKKTANISEGIMGYDTNPQYSPDGKFIAWQSMERDGYESDQNRLMVMNLETGEKIFASKDFDSNVDGFVWSADAKALYFTGVWHGESQVYKIDLTDSNKITPLTSGMYDYAGVALLGEHKLIVQRHSLSMGDEIYSIDLADNNKIAQLTTENKHIYDQLTIGKVEGRWMKTTDGKQMLTWVIYPPHFDPNKKYPMIVYYYGGTSPTNRALEMRYSMHMYAALGYVVYTLNPSGTTGFGQEFAARHVNAWGLKTADEIIQGTKLFCKEHSFVNEKKIGCIGASYGGFMTQYLQTRTDIFAAAISHAGISALSSYWGEGYWGYGYCSVANAGTYPWNAPEFFTKQSPLFNADKINTPLVLLHGNADTNVPIGESIQMFAALKILGKTVEFVQVDGENHGIVGYQKRIGWQNTIYAWFAKWLKDEPEWWKALYPDRTL